jgi:hypothetical protein
MAPTERTPARESANNGHSFVARMVDGSEGCFGSGRDRSSDRTTVGPVPPVKDEMVSIMGRTIPGVGNQFKAKTRRPE